jgi:hypothetical protein
VRQSVHRGIDIVHLLAPEEHVDYLSNASAIKRDPLRRMRAIMRPEVFQGWLVGEGSVLAHVARAYIGPKADTPACVIFQDKCDDRRFTERLHPAVDAGAVLYKELWCFSLPRHSKQRPGYLRTTGL